MALQGAHHGAQKSTMTHSVLVDGVVEFAVADVPYFTHVFT